MISQIRTIILIICIIDFTSGLLFGQVSQEWVARYNYNNLGAYGYYVTTDRLGYIYVTGASTVSGTQWNIVTIKYNTSGVQQWSVTYNGPGIGQDFPTGIAVDDSSNIYVIGCSVGSGTGYDAVTIKYNTNGIQRWISRYNGSNNFDDYSVSLSLDNSGHLYITGNSINLYPPYQISDVLTIKYNAYTGDSIWTRIFHEAPGPMGHYNDAGGKIAFDRLGNVIVTGASEYSFGPPFMDYLTLKYNSSGSLLWYRKYNGTGNLNDDAYLLILDTLNNIYVSGYSVNTSGNGDYLTIKYDPSGVQQWIARYNGTGNYNDAPNGMAIDKYNNIYVTGYSYGSNNLSDYLTIKYNSNGDSLWVDRYHGPGNNNDGAYGLVLDDSSNVYITGASSNTNNGLDIATIKYNTNGVQQWTIRYSNGGVGGAPGGIAQPIVIDASRNVYVTGHDGGAYGDLITIKYSQLSGIKPISNKIPEKFNLYQNFPNPFNPSTKITFTVPLRKGGLRGLSLDVLEIYDILGHKIATLVNQQLKPGTYEIQWDGSDFPSGVYFYSLLADDFTMTKKMVLLK